ncbi:methyl-accepting chemotaxis protein [Actimicrobium sp. CCC2.4]|uniref:methyl-accepting chemotaxis protein n=1 Tax=Actimicrobium sp. CCC2.4 TaxID=3048606 RepID=UPI002AC9730F|nr:methyl-accepting chemotaxis protein [Actimicrobium sp. CCC2.4]MEB0133855.1 methyl-accepting chemotaxis protein [Actimicrobium sp. CCC2.4]WPX31396.1 methyl-accepting chemotaxis protein [Actimicrobium sp. CCC2.4]
MKNLKIGSRLGIAFAALLLLQLIVTGVGLHQIGGLSDRLSFILDVGNTRIDALNEIDSAIGQRAIAARNLALLPDPSKQQADVTLVKESQSDINKGFIRLSELMKDPAITSDKSRQMLEKLRALEAIYLPIANNVVTLATTQKTELAIKAITQDCMPVLIQVHAHIVAFGKSLKEETGAAANEAKTASQTAVWTLLIISAFSLVAGTLLGWRINMSITGPLTAAVDIAKRVAAGDLTSRIVVTSNDETGQLLNALKDMNDSLTGIVGQVRQGTDTIATASAEIAAGNMDLSSRTEQQASSLEETASSMEELTGTSKQNADNARQANKLASSASEVAVKGGAVVSQVVSTMGSINESAKKIADIIGVIDGIAFQTNILALNAAVEAARAGEQGRGFAVVASEVRSLAQRSAAAAKDIKGLINDSVEKVDAGTKLVDQAGASMSEIVDSVRRVTDIISEIAAASEEQTAGIEQVNQAISQMDEVTQQNAALVEQAAAAAESLQDQSGNLAHTVSAFKLDNQGMAGMAMTRLPAASAAGKQSQVKKPSVLARTAPASRTAAVTRKIAPAPVAAAGGEWEEF